MVKIAVRWKLYPGTMQVPQARRGCTGLAEARGSGPSAQHSHRCCLCLSAGCVSLLLVYLAIASELDCVNTILLPALPA